MAKQAVFGALRLEHLGWSWKINGFLRKGTSKLLPELLKGLPGKGGKVRHSRQRGHHACLGPQTCHPGCSTDQDGGTPGQMRLGQMSRGHVIQRQVSLRAKGTF